MCINPKIKKEKDETQQKDICSKLKAWHIALIILVCLIALAITAWLIYDAYMRELVFYVYWLPKYKYTKDKQQRQLDMMNSYEMESASAAGGRSVGLMGGKNRNSTMQNDSKQRFEIENNLKNIEQKLNKANEYRTSILSGDKERLSFYKNKVQ